MLLQINRKILIYLFIFFLLGTYTNKKFLNLSFPKIESYQITGLSEVKNNQIYQDLSELQKKNKDFLNKEEISKIISSHKMIEKFYVFKIYPSNLNIVIEKTNFLAQTKKNGIDFFIGSNGNLIEAKNDEVDLPFVFGNIDIKEFLKLKKTIDDSNFSFKEIKNLYYFKSRRWDIETKDNLLIKLPIEKLETSLELIIKIQEKKDLNFFKTIDLRQNNQVILNG